MPVDIALALTICRLVVPRPNVTNNPEGAMVITACPQLGLRQVSNTPTDYRIRIAVRIIEELRGDIHLNLKECSGLLGVTEAHLLRLFKREIGMTFRGYLRKE